MTTELNSVVAGDTLMADGGFTCNDGRHLLDGQVGTDDCVAGLTLATSPAPETPTPTWQTIDTAPTDGTPVDLWVEFENGGERHPDMTYREGGPGECNDWEDLSGMYSLCGDMRIDLGQVTHWMERPAGPNGEPCKPDK